LLISSDNSIWSRWKTFAYKSALASLALEEPGAAAGGDRWNRFGRLGEIALVRHS
jgi:hypothetical protein